MASLQSQDLSLSGRFEGLEEFRSRAGARRKSVKRDVSYPMRIVPHLDVGRFAPPGYEIDARRFESLGIGNASAASFGSMQKATLPPVCATSALISVNPSSTPALHSSTPLLSFSEAPQEYSGAGPPHS
jgi:hypothetical protein